MSGSCRRTTLRAREEGGHCSRRSQSCPSATRASLAHLARRLLPPNTKRPNWSGAMSTRPQRLVDGGQSALRTIALRSVLVLIACPTLQKDPRLLWACGLSPLSRLERRVGRHTIFMQRKLTILRWQQPLECEFLRHLQAQQLGVEQLQPLYESWQIARRLLRCIRKLLATKRRKMPCTAVHVQAEEW